MKAKSYDDLFNKYIRAKKICESVVLIKSGSTGSFAFYYPNKELFFVGDFNQMKYPALPIKFVIQLAMFAP